MASTSAGAAASNKADAWKQSTDPTDHFVVTGTGANKLCSCKWCPKEFKGSGSRCYVHLTGDGKGVSTCPHVPTNVVQGIKAAKIATAAGDKTGKRKAEVDLHGDERSSSRAAAGPSRGESAPPPAPKGPVRPWLLSTPTFHPEVAALLTVPRLHLQMQQFLNRTSVKQVHDSFADVVFKEGLPMRITKSKHLQKWIKDLRALPKETPYKTPAYDTLRTTLLQDAKKRVTKELDPWERQAKESGCTICSDGWGDAANRPLLNVLGVNAKGAKFISAINTEGHQKTAEYIAEQLMQAILIVGPENVVQVGTLTTANGCVARDHLV